MWKEGELADENFVRAGITRAEDKVVKDHLVIYRRRSCLLTFKAKKARAAEKGKRKRNAQEEALANAVPLTIVVDGDLEEKKRRG